MNYDSDSTTFWARQNYGDHKRIGGRQGVPEGGVNRRGTGEGFQGPENTPCDTATMGPCHQTFVQTRGMHGTASEP